MSMLRSQVSRNGPSWTQGGLDQGIWQHNGELFKKKWPTVCNDLH